MLISPDNSGLKSAASAIKNGELTAFPTDTYFALGSDGLNPSAVEDVFRTLATEDRAERLENPGMEEGRADVIVGGMCVLVRVMRQFGFEHCLVSEADILDGLVMSQLR